MRYLEYKDKISSILDQNQMGFLLARKPDGSHYFFKHDGSVLRYAMFMDISSMLPEEYDERVNDICKDFAAIRERYGARNIIVCLALYSVFETELTREILRGGEEYFDQEIYIVEYVCTSETDVIRSPEKCSAGVFGIDKLVKSPTKPKKKRLAKPLSEKNEKPIAALVLLAINIFVFMCTYIYDSFAYDISLETLINAGGMVRELFLQGEFYRVLTANFLHANLMHVLSNALFMVVFGKMVERHFGTLVFLLIYLGSGIIAVFTNGMMTGAVLIGASGAVCGLTGSVLMLLIRTKKTIDGMNLYSMVALTIMSVGLGFAMPNTGNIAHITGLIAGGLIALPFINMRMYGE